ncbi:hypothetical protein MnTg02_03144 [bacterium MnTg02]|nr:hypothetical protein MnTg02_03144 [bacterium MnTg02]
MTPTRASYPLKLPNMEHIPLLLYALLTIKVLQIKVNKALTHAAPEFFRDKNNATACSRTAAGAMARRTINEREIRNAPC